MQLADPVANDGLFVHQPRVLVLLPDLLRAAHHHEQVERIEGGDGLSGVELDSAQGESRIFQRGPERARVLVGMVLQYERAPLTARVSGGFTAGCRDIP